MRSSSTPNNKGVHQFLVETIRKLMSVVKEDLLYLPLAHSRCRCRWTRRTVPSQLLEPPLHVDYLCVHRRTELSVAIANLLRYHRWPCGRIELPPTPHCFLATLPVVLVAKPCSLHGSKRAVATVVTWLTTLATTVWVRVLRHVARLRRHLSLQCSVGSGTLMPRAPGLGLIFFCNYEKNLA